MIKACAASVSFFLTIASSTVHAGEEPWGGNVAGWKFTQTDEPGGVINCRALQGQNQISRRSNGRSYVSLPAPAGLPKGWYKEGKASIIIGGAAEPIDAEVTGRLLLHIDDSQYPVLTRARGYQWRVMGPGGIQTGTVSYSGDIGKVFSEVRACAQANSGPAKSTAKPPTTAKWSGDWVWIRPLTLFGKPVDTKGQRLSIELLQGNRVNICVDLRRNDTCKNVPFTSQSNGVQSLSPNGTDLMEVRYLNDTLSGQFWFQKGQRASISPDATFLLRR